MGRSRFRWLLDGLLTIAIFALLFLVAARLDHTSTQETLGRAVVNDGDTITIAGERIRLKGMDAPELGQTCTRDGAEYACGRHASEALKAIVGGREVSCASQGRDKYGRLLAFCSAGGVELNRYLVQNGLAVAYGDYEREEADARRRKVGMWAGEFDMPRDWRARHGGMVEAEHAGRSLIDWLIGVLQLR